MTNLDEVVRYPAGITPHGEYHLLNGQIPSMHFHAYDGSVDFRMLGGLAAPYSDPKQPAVLVKSLKGLIAPWQFVDQKGATQHGVTTVANLFDPIEVTAECELIGDDRKALRELVRAWIASNEHMKTGELSFITPELGRWWAPVRWYKTPPNSILLALLRNQPFSQVWRADNAFWRTYDSADSFRIVFDDTVSDAFTTETETGLGDDWDIEYSGDGGGSVYSDGFEVAWVDDPMDPVAAGGRDAICRRSDFVGETDNMVVEMSWGGVLDEDAYGDLWGRMANTGTPGDDGVRLRVGLIQVTLSYFIDGTETVLRQFPRDPSSPFGPVLQQLVAARQAAGNAEKWRLVCGDEDNFRLIKVFRDGALVQSVIANGALSGAGYRSAGVGLHVNESGTDFRTTLGIVRWSVADNRAATASGFVKLTNPGDQPMWPRYTCFGPGTFTFANGPGSTDYVQFGPLLPNQVMQVRTDPELRPIINMTSVPPTPQELTVWQQAVSDFINFATAGNVPPLLQQIKSVFGIVAPQGHPYSLLSGAFSNPVPAKSPGSPAQSQHIAVSISGGNASSMILAVGTPLRRYPL